MPEYLKHGPHGFCQRCSQKFYLDELVEDGNMDGLFVCDECYDDYHPQRDPVHISHMEGVLEDPLPPNDADGAKAIIGGHVNLATLLPIIPVPFQFVSGTVSVTV